MATSFRTERTVQILLPDDESTDEEKEVLRPSGWKLDATRTNIYPEICSRAGIDDIVRFILWLFIGYMATWGLNALLGWLDNQACAYLIFHCGFLLDGIQEFCTFLSLGGIMGAFYIRSWWFLSFCVGGAVRLIQRDLIAHRTWENCQNLNVHGPYIWNQKFVQFSGPVAALWFVMTSQALDRMYKRRNRSQKPSQGGVRESVAKALVEQIFGPANNVYNPFSQGIGVCRSSGPASASAAVDHGLVSFKLICGSNQEEIALYTYGDLACHEDDSKMMMKAPTPSADCACADKFPICNDDDSSDSDETPQLHQLRVGEFATKLNGKFAMLIYNAEGQHLLRQLSMKHDSTEPWLLSFELEQDFDHYNQILEAYHSEMPVLLFVPGGSWARPSFLWSTEPPKSSWRKIRFLVLISFPAVFCYLCLKLGYGPRLSVLLLVLPDLVEAFVNDQNQTDITSTHFNETIKNGQKTIKNVMSSTWSCVHGKDLIRTQAALFTSTFFFVACQLILVIACYHLHEASRSLHELNDLLMVLLYRKEDHEYQAVLLHKLHEIRRRITNVRCLDHFADHAFPQTLGPDKSLIWWFQTRAAIFADIQFNMEKRIVVLLLCLFLSIALGMLAIVVSQFNLDEDGFGIICYAFAHGVSSAVILILYFFFGSRVNAELRSGIETLKRLYKKSEENEENETDAESQSLRSGRMLTPRATPRGGPALFDPEDGEDIHHLLEHAKHKPYTLKFLCFNLTTGFFSVVATPLATFAASLIWLVLKRYGFDFLKGAT